MVTNSTQAYKHIGVLTLQWRGERGLAISAWKGLNAQQMKLGAKRALQ